MLFTDEVENMEQLIDKLSTYDDLGKIKVAVVCFLFNKSGNLVLHRRGPGARDEVGKLQAIGGSVNRQDENFRAALHRELREEAGTEATIRIDDFIGAQIDGKVDRHTGEFVNWIILGYKGKITNGELINMEPERCIGFERNRIEDFKKEDLSTTAYNFIQAILNEE